MSLGRHPGGSQRVLQVLGTPGTGMEACRWQTSWGEPEGAPGSGDPRHWNGGLQVDLGGPTPPQIGKAGFGHLGLHRENGKVKGWEVWG